MKKRYVVLMLLFALRVSPVFSFSLSSLARGSFKQFDMPLIDGIAYFQKSIGDFYGIALRLSTLLGIVCILWNAFRLWMGTQEVRKACVDIITKFTLFVFLMNAYPVIVGEVIDTAVNIGMHAGGGYNKVNAAFYALREDCETKIRVARETLYAILREGKDGGALNTESIKLLAQITYIEEDEVESFLKDKGVEVFSQEDYDNLGNGWWNKLFPSREQRELSGKMTEFVNSIDVDAALALAGDKDLQQAMITMKAMEEVMTEQTVDGEPGEGESRIKTYLYNPFMTDREGKQTNILSPGAMIKTAVLISDVISRQGSMEYSSDRKGFIEKKLDETFQKAISLILIVLMTFGLVMASIFCVIQYVMCVFEYFIVTAVGVIFIPFCLWDGTKSFTAKLVTLFTSYFIKIMVMVLCLFWVYSAFIYMGVSIMSSNEPVSFLSFSYFIFTCLLGWVVTQNGPQVAVAVLNRTPQLSMGEFLHAAGTAVASAAMAKRAAAAGGNALKTGGKAAQAGVRAGQTVDAAYSGSTAAIEAARKAAGGTLGKKQELGIRMGALSGIIGSGIRNTAATLVTGQEKKEGGISVGGGSSMDNKAKDNSRTREDSELAARSMGSKYGEEWAKDKAPKAPEEPEKPSGVEGLKRD
ncbi:MAG: type IV secretion system protein [Treponema sp.]|jgi:type IV secretion system protein TrbL|nr:type IV secretion system protein [Treponema sp.]